MFISANNLVNDFGFKRKTKNKEKLLINEEYNITLKTLNGYCNIFTDDKAKKLIKN